MWGSYALKYYSTLQRRKTLSFITRMNLEDIMLCDISQAQNDNMHDHIHVGITEAEGRMVTVMARGQRMLVKGHKS